MIERLLMKVTKKLAFVISVILINLVSCSYAPSKSYVETNHNNSKLLLPKFIKYIENDKTIPEPQRDIRKQAIEEWMDLNKTAYEALVKE